jgi:hypothetical protein
MSPDTPETLEVHDEHGYLNVAFIGEFSLEAAKRTIDRIFQDCSDPERSRVLLDLRKMTGKLSIMDRFQSVIYGQKLIGKVVKLALVAPREAILPDLFAETVAVNRGINMKVLTDVKAALRWLKS